MDIIISIDIGIKTFTGVVLHNKLIQYTLSADLQVNGKDLPRVVSTLQDKCTILLERARLLGDQIVIIVEKQIGKFAFAQIESAVYMYFHLQNLQTVQINPRNKLKVCIPGVVVQREFKKKYDANKYLAKMMFDAYLQQTAQVVQVETKYKKDVADAVLQALWFISQEQCSQDDNITPLN